ncbi:MAG: YlaI family protein [Bacilli bacterium]
MRVKCALCDTISVLSDENPIAKKIKNRPIHTYMCEPCSARITNTYKERVAVTPHQYNVYRTETAGWGERR